jgi:hypothetical protein
MAEITETHDLIASDKVEGTPVFQPDGWRIGQIERLMLDKVSGTVAYAVMSFGGFVGIGHHHYPVPWPMLDYNTEYKGYTVNLTREQIEEAPKLHPEHEDHVWSSEYGHDVYGFYGVPPYWMNDVGR